MSEPRPQRTEQPRTQFTGYSGPIVTGLSSSPFIAIPPLRFTGPAIQPTQAGFRIIEYSLSSDAAPAITKAILVGLLESVRASFRARQRPAPAENDSLVPALLSEAALSDWDREEERIAWAHLRGRRAK